MAQERKQVLEPEQELHHEHACSCEHEHADEHHHDHGCSCGHGHGHEHGREHGGEEGGRGRLIAICAASALFLAGLLAGGTPRLILFAAAYLLVGFDVLREAAENILHGEVFDEAFLMAVASIGAICLGEYAEAAAVMILYQLGEFLQDKAVDASRDSIRSLMDVRPDTANLVENGTVTEVRAEQVPVGAVIRVHAGESIPLDGTVLSGTSTLNTAALTGESLPREAAAGDTVLSGCVNLTGTLTVRVDKPYGESAASRILKLVEEAEESKAQPERFITRFARIYTPVVVILALLLAILPPLLGLGTFAEYIKRALNFLVISCPCALVISIPLSFFAGLGCASHNGILIKGASYFEPLSHAEIAVFDKTGTLTRGRFSVDALQCAGSCDEDTLLTLAAYAESHSNHPLARSILSAYQGTLDPARLDGMQEISGRGVRALLDGKVLLAGTAAFLHTEGIEAAQTPPESTAVHIAYDGSYRGAVLLRDAPKADAREALDALRSLGVRKNVMLSGDSSTVAQAIGKELGLDEVHAPLLPEEKLRRLQTLKGELSEKGKLLYSGDGINDTPVLYAADVGIAMGALGADAAMEAADVVIMSDEPSKVAQAVRLARKTQRIATENIAFSIGVKVLFLLLSTLGFIGLWAAVFADVGVCMLCILNALRAMR